MTTGIYHGVRDMAGGERFPETMPNDLKDEFDFAAKYLPSNRSAALNYGLVSLFRFDEPSGIRYDKVGCNHLIENGGTIAQASGKIGFSALIASSPTPQWLSVPDNPSLTFTTAFTLSIWFKHTDLGTNRVIASKWDYQTQGSWAFQTGISVNSELAIYIADSLADAGGNRGETSGLGLTSGTWYHACLIYDGSLTGNANRLKLFINNVQKTLTFTGTIPASLQNSTADLKFGKFGGSLTRYFNGAVDAGRLYNRAVTAAEVALLYNSGTGVE